MMKYYLLILGILLIDKSYGQLPNRNPSTDDKHPIEALIQNLENSRNKEVIVVAHRGDWRNAPENSLQAIQNCIDMGVDMVEIDIRETRDGELVLMHDKKLNRTTNGKGRVKHWTLDRLKTLHLKDGLGMETPHRIPTLEEALLLAKGKILIILDKSYDILDKCYEVMERTNTLNQVIIKGEKTRSEIERKYGKYLDKVYFVPIVKLPNSEAKKIVNDYLENRLPIAFEFTVPQDTIKMIDYFDDIRANGASVWVNAIWSRFNADHDDEKAVYNPAVYDWYIENDIDIIQTDRPQLLLDYLRKKGLHN